MFEPGHGYLIKCIQTVVEPPQCKPKRFKISMPDSWDGVPTTLSCIPLSRMLCAFFHVSTYCRVLHPGAESSAADTHLAAFVHLIRLRDRFECKGSQKSEKARVWLASTQAGESRAQHSTERNSRSARFCQTSCNPFTHRVLKALRDSEQELRPRVSLSRFLSNLVGAGGGGEELPDIAPGNTLPLVAMPWGFNHWAPQTSDPGQKTSWWLLAKTTLHTLCGCCVCARARFSE